MRTSVLLLFLALFSSCSSHVAFYLSPDGNDAWSGRLASPNKNQTDGPFRTLHRAQEATRNAQGPVTVFLRDGLYTVDSTIHFTRCDGKGKIRPVCWTAFKHEIPRLCGGKAIDHFEPVRDEKIRQRLPLAVRDRVLVCDLASQGITHYNDPPLRMSLYYRGERMQPARYPNQGWTYIGDVPQQGEKLFHPGDHKVIKFGLPAGRHFGRFHYDDDRPSLWQPADDIWMHGFWVWDWRDTYQKIRAIDTAKKLIYPAEPHHAYGYEKGQRYYYLNVLEELDSPGEWQLDVSNHRLYFLPPAQLHPGDVLLSTL
ncbi:hypothetical protein GX408_15755, partial [bacterium]|nr:hypothetical protein [bacterium]